MLTYKNKSTFIVFMSDGEYDDFIRIPICLCDTFEEANKVTKELNDALELLNLGEHIESTVLKDLFEEYAPSHEAIFSWEMISTVSFKED